MHNQIKLLPLILLFSTSSLWAQAKTVVADLAKDFGGQNPAGSWSYLWNANGSMGYSTNYTELKPANIFLKFGDTSYSPDGTSDLPSKIIKDANDLYLRRDPGAALVVGDCGLGVGQGARQERYNIMAFKIAKGGVYSIVQSSLKSAVATKRGNGFHYKVYVNDSFIKGGMVQPMESVTFDCDLGILSNGDIIYVAIGPGQVTDCTNFDIEYQIVSSD